jgi:uncharacterized protein YbaR (Trm112 family)
MKTVLIKNLRCPETGTQLTWEGLAAANDDEELFDGWLVSDNRQHRYPVRGGIARFVPESNYADNF